MTFLACKRVRRLAASTLLALCAAAAAPLTTSAHGNIWMDENMGQNERVTKYSRIILFPLSDSRSIDGRPDQYQEWNAEFAKRINKRIKKTNFICFQDPNDTQAADKRKEREMILRSKPEYQKLLHHFPTEEDRARAVDEATGAEGYLLPHIRYWNERTDVSPATWTNVSMESYYDIEDGPNGDQSKLDHRTWTESHLIPESSKKLEMLDLDFTIYDARTRKKVLTLVDYYRCYNVTPIHAFEQITKNFSGDWDRLKKDKDNNPPAGAPTLGFANLELPWSAAQDEFSIKTIYYAFKDEAGDTLKRVKVNYQPEGGRYIAGGTINTYERGERWIAPHVTTYPSLDKTEDFTWYDKNGNAHKGKRKYYKTSITDNYGYNQFYYHVNATLWLKDSLTGETILWRTYDEEDADRYANALRKIFGDFYREADKAIGVQI